MTLYEGADLPLLDVSEDVARAISDGAAVVALESTIITHGMPYPENVETARSVEAVVRGKGAVPATIALIEGRIRVGLDDATLDRLGRADGVFKASGRDMAALMVRGVSAGTTVSATMRIAALAGIRVFATGGVGGVHRGAETTFDISADLNELGRTEVAVVCAGVKSILDISKTLEYLETQRVPVLVHGADVFPAFYTRDSGMRADHRCDTPEELAAVIAIHLRLGTGTGLLIANPITEADALDRDLIEDIIAEAVAEADRQGIRRKELTPFLLARIVELSGGRSLTANIALIRNNAALAAEIAVALGSL